MSINQVEQVKITPVDFKKAQLSRAIAIATPSTPTETPVRFQATGEALQLAPEFIEIVGITEKIQKLGALYQEEVFYPVLGEEAQKALFNDLKTMRLNVAVDINGKQFVAKYKAPSPAGFTCGYYETSLAALPAMQKSYGRLVNNKVDKNYRYEPVQAPTFTGDFIDPAKALELEFKDRIIVNGDEEVLVRLGKTFTVKEIPTPESVESKPEEIDDDLDLDINLDLEIEDEFIETPSENAKLSAFLG